MDSASCRARKHHALSGELRLLRVTVRLVATGKAMSASKESTPKNRFNSLSSSTGSAVRLSQPRRCMSLTGATSYSRAILPTPLASVSETASLYRLSHFSHSAAGFPNAAESLTAISLLMLVLPARMRYTVCRPTPRIAASSPCDQPFSPSFCFKILPGWTGLLSNRLEALIPDPLYIRIVRMYNTIVHLTLLFDGRQSIVTKGALESAR